MVKRVIGKYKSISLPAKASLWFIACSLIQKGISFFTTPIFTRLLSTSEYGEAVLYSSWMEIVTIFATMQLATGVFNKAMIKFSNDRDGFTSSMLFLSSVITIAFFLVYLISRTFWDKIFDLPSELVVMMFMDIFISSVMAFFSIRNRFEYKYKSVIFFTLLVAILGPLSSFIFVINVPQGNQAEAKVFGQLLVKIFVYFFVYIKIIKKGSRLVAKDYWKYAIGYNLPLIPHYLSQQVLTQSDRIMINSICGKDFAAIYGVAYQLSMVAFLFTYAIHNSFTPWTFENIKNKNYGSIGKKAIIIELVIGFLCFLFSLFAPELIYILGGDTYMTAVWIVPPVSMSVLFQTIYTFFGNVEFYFEKTKFVMVASIVCAISNVVLNAIFIPKYGFAAAGYTTLACYMLYAIVHYAFMKRIERDEGIDGIYNGKIMWCIATAFAGFSVLASFLYNCTILRYVVIFMLMSTSIFYFTKNKNRIIAFIKM